MMGGTWLCMVVARTVVLAEVEPLKDVCVPGLQVDGKGALALAATLVDIPGELGGRQVNESKASLLMGEGCPGRFLHPRHIPCYLLEDSETKPCSSVAIIRKQ